MEVLLAILAMLTRTDVPLPLYVAGIAGLTAIQIAAFRLSNPDWVGRLIELIRRNPRGT